MILGFAGTRHGMTPEQLCAVIQYIIKLRALAKASYSAHSADKFDELEGLHGDCVGADAQFDAVCRGLRIQTTCRPCDISSMRADTPAREVAPEMPAMARNRLIVRDSTQILACPYEMTAQQRGGTWATIRFAERAGKPLRIIYPDGSHTISGG